MDMRMQTETETETEMEVGMDHISEGLVKGMKEKGKGDLGKNNDNYNDLR